jgi:hypothetical protein
MNAGDAESLAEEVAGLYPAITPAQAGFLHVETLNITKLLDTVREEAIRRAPRKADAKAERRRADASWQEAEAAVRGLSNATFDEHLAAVLAARPELRRLLGHGPARESRLIQALVHERVTSTVAAEPAADDRERSAKAGSAPAPPARVAPNEPARRVSASARPAGKPRRDRPPRRASAPA